MSGEAFLLNRQLESLAAPWTRSDVLFAGQRLDGVTIELALYAHCTFANLSLKGCEFRDSHFINCVFVSCYFRKTLFSGCKFDGCKFIDCDLPKVRIQGSSFIFPRFTGTFIPFDEMQPNLPPEPELRSIAATELAREAQAAGHAKDARLYRIEAIRATEGHLWAGFRASTSWYRERYDVAARLDAGVRWFGSQVNRLLWGNGERGWVLLRSFFVLVFVLFPLVFYVARSGLQSAGRTTLSDYLLLSADNATGRSGFSGVATVSTTTRIFTGLELAVGFMLFGLFVTILFRRITRWRL